MNTIPKENNKNLTPHWESAGRRNRETPLPAAYTALHHPEQTSNLIFPSRFLPFPLQTARIANNTKTLISQNKRILCLYSYLHGQFTPSPLLKLHTIVLLKPFPPSNSANN